MKNIFILFFLFGVIKTGKSQVDELIDTNYVIENYLNKIHTDKDIIILTKVIEDSIIWYKSSFDFSDKFSKTYNLSIYKRDIINDSYFYRKESYENNIEAYVVVYAHNKANQVFISDYMLPLNNMNIHSGRIDSEIIGNSIKRKFTSKIEKIEDWKIKGNYQGKKNINNCYYYSIQYSNMELLFDATTFLLSIVKKNEFETYFSDYRLVGNNLIPFKEKRFINEELYYEAQILNYQINEKVDSKIFNIEHPLIVDVAKKNSFEE